MTDSLPKEIVPMEVELKASQAICDLTHILFGSARVPEVAKVIAKHTRADGLTALQQKERAEKAEKELRLISEHHCGIQVEGEVTLDMVYAFVEGIMQKLYDQRLTAEQALSAAEASLNTNNKTMNELERLLKLADAYAGYMSVQRRDEYQSERVAFLKSRSPTTTHPTPAGEEGKR